MEQHQKYIKHLGFPKSDGYWTDTALGKRYDYIKKFGDKTNSLKITYFFYSSEDALFEFHLSEWNKNEIDFFIAVGEDNSHIIRAKEKSNNENILKSNVLVPNTNFNYGINTSGFESIIPSDIPFSKENLDNSFFFSFVLQKSKDVKNEIDTHLLNNLIALKEELSKFDNDSENINALILKCLFIKYFEDREVLLNLSFVDALKSEKVENVLKTFEQISTINGDILKKDLKIKPEHLFELKIFFTEDYKEYKKSGQQYIPELFPYKFDKIPIQLISNIYEEFLGKTEKKKKGIFYTRTFVVDFMLSHTIYPKIKENPQSTILDPACGSGAFLVQAFKKILNANDNANLSIEDKATILKKQIFGVDIDANALQITAFSLYLTLLEEIKDEDIQKQIAIKQPILPSLIDTNLISKNTITDDINFNFIIETTGEQVNRQTFDCIIANPPWTQLKKSDVDNEQNEQLKIEIEKSRKAIQTLSIYKNVNQIQTSQAFLLKINEFCHANTDIAIIVNNSNFLNTGDKNNNKPIEFRKELLTKYQLDYFYELSEIAPILFKGTEHPCAVLLLNKKTNENHNIKYITPQLTDFSKKLRVISYSSKDVKEVKQSDLLKEDILWRIFVKGDWKDYQLIKKIDLKRNNDLYVTFCGRGINPNKATPNGEPIYKNMLDAGKLDKFIIKRTEQFNINQSFERGRTDKDNLFKGSRILLRRIPSPKDKLKLSAVFVNDELYFKEQIISVKLNEPKLHKPYTSLLNSSLIGFYLNQTSAQTNKGKKMTAIRHEEITKLPLFKFSKTATNELEEIHDRIIKSLMQSLNISQYEDVIDNIVFREYELLDFEKEIIREFYQINVERKNDLVRQADIEKYVEKFREVYAPMVKENLRLNVSFVKSINIGTIVRFEIVDESHFQSAVMQGDYTDRIILQLVKKYQIEKELFAGYINEEKVKIYDNKSFYIIKSNQFKDWTQRQAMEDAREEIHEMLKKMM